MRTSVIFAGAVVLLLGCDRRPPQRSVATQPVTERSIDDGPVQPADALRPDDMAVIDAALTDFAADPKFEPMYKPFEIGKRLIVDRETAGGSAYVRGVQVRADAAEGKLPEDAVADLEARNNGPQVLVSGTTFSSTRRAGASLDGFKPSSPEVLVDDFKKFPNDEMFGFEKALQQAHPDAKGYVLTSLPGYTADGRRAILRLPFGPTPHGATATYLLEKDSAGKWKVVWRGRAFYA